MWYLLLWRSKTRLSKKNKKNILCSLLHLLNGHTCHFPHCWIDPLDSEAYNRCLKNPVVLKNYFSLQLVLHNNLLKALRDSKWRNDEYLPFIKTHTRYFSIRCSGRLYMWHFVCVYLVKYFIDVKKCQFSTILKIPTIRLLHQTSTVVLQSQVS